MLTISGQEKTGCASPKKAQPVQATANETG
jgi:hypothetical protein